MAEFEKYLEESGIVDEITIPATGINYFFAEDKECAVIIKKKSKKPSELFVIKLFIDDYEDLKEYELICECESELKFRCPAGKWEMSFKGEKLYFYRCIDDSEIDSFVIKIIE